MNLKEKNRNCKCNHMKFDHDKGTFNRKECTKCNCNEFMRRDAPIKLEIVWAIITIGYFGIAIASVVLIAVEFENVTDDMKNVIIDPEDDEPTTIGKLLHVTFYIWIGFLTVFCLILFEMGVLPVFDARRRKVRD